MDTRIISLVVTIVGLLAVPALSEQDNERDKRKEHIAEAWATFKQDHQDNWRARWHDSTFLPKMMIGGKAGPFPGTPDHAAESFIEAHKALFALEDDTASLELQRTRKTPGGNQVVFQQRYRGVDIYRGLISVIVNEAGEVVAVTSSVWPVRNLDLNAALSVDAVSDVITSVAKSDPVNIVEGPTLIIYPEDEGRLAYHAYVRVGAAAVPYEYVIDANSGAVIRSAMLLKEHRRPGPRG